MSTGQDPVGRNRYAPPRGAVADPADARADRRPRSVGVAVLLMAASFLLSVAVDAPVLWGEVATGLQPVWVLAVIGLLYALVAWLIGRLHRGRNWARWVLLAFSVVSVGLMVADPSLAGDTTIAVVAGIVSTVLDAVALVLVFTPPGSGWFRAS